MIQRLCFHIPPQLATKNMLVRLMAEYGAVNIAYDHAGYSVVWQARGFTVQTSKHPTARKALLRAYRARFR